MQKRLFLIDGTALAYRSFFAFQGSGRTTLTTTTGTPTAATYGFINTLKALLQRERPDALAVAFDGPRQDLYRTSVYPEYKSTRNKMPDEMALQLDDIRQVVQGYGMRIVDSPKDEADDVIGTLAVQGRDAGMQVFVVTGDKDFMQLVDDRIKLWNLRSSTSKPEILGAAEVQARYGVRPDQMIDLLALMGDSSDNIPGVPRVGEKTAGELLAQFGSLDGIYDHLDEIKKPALQKTLREHREQALLSRTLVTLRTDLELGVDVQELGPAQPDAELLRPLFRRLEFDSLLSALEAPPATAAVEQRYRTVRSEGELEQLFGEVRAAGRCGLWLETSGANLRDLKLLGVALAPAAGVAGYLPLQLEPPILEGGRQALLARLGELLGTPGLQVATANSKQVLAVLQQASLPAPPGLFDTALCSYCLQPGIVAHDLDAQVLRRFGVKKTAQKQLLGVGKQQKTFDMVDPTLASTYACEGADYTLRLCDEQQGELEQQQVQGLYRELEQPLVPVLLAMEWEGIAVDLEHLRKLSLEMGRRIGELEQRIWQRAGAEFNLGSPQQVGKVLFDDLEVHLAAQMPRPRRTPTGQYKTDADVLERLAPHHEVPQLLLEWRMLQKLKGTYVDSLPQMVHPATGRIHTTFNQTVAATGRLSSDNPNLQNIPIRTAEGQKVRAAFVARAADWLLLSADYSQIELRILAHLSGDKALVESFQKGEDIHARTAALVHGLLPAMVTPELRNQAKVINYGLMYGMGASRLANETGMTPPQARKFIDAYFRALPGVKRYLDGSLQQARSERQVWTMFGRKRPLPDIDSTNAGLRNAAENMAVNTPIQGAAADIVKRAMLRVHAELLRRKLRARLLLQVHDELVFDVPQDELAEVRLLVKEAMMGAAELTVPLEVAIGTGHSWLEAH